MIGIVIVSHSRKLSDGLKEMAEAMTNQPVPIASAGGVDDPDSPLGTDGIRVLEGIREVMSEDGVLIFADLGSAKLNAEMALDLLEPEEREKVRFCDAPLVEGVLAAAVQSATGAGIDAVAQEALQSGAQKGGAAGTGEPGPPDIGADGPSREFVIRNPMGLHARPAARLVAAMSAFHGDIRLTNVTKGKKPVNAKSINGIMLSEVSGNDRITVTAEPDEAEAVFAELARLVDENFGETGEVRPRSAAAKTDAGTSVPDGADTALTGELKGIPISAGYALGPLHHVKRGLPEVAAVKVEDVQAELRRLEKALDEAEAGIDAALGAGGDRLGAYDRKIFEAHKTYLRDPEIIDAVKARITLDHICAEAAWHDVVSTLADTYAKLDDPLLKARAADVTDVGLRVMTILTGAERVATVSGAPAILAFGELHPSDVLSLDREKVLGICAARGGKTSHAAILASALGIPVVFALGDGLEGVPDGQEVLLDGTAGKLDPEPGEEAVKRMKKDSQARAERLAQAQAVRDLPARTSDGHEVRAAANMATENDVTAIADSGAQEVGLFRTEFLFMDRDAAPDEDAQYEVYRRIVTGLKGKPLTVRTADIGGDKPVVYLDRPAEANPNLGWRGIRYSLDAPDFFDTQLAAILRASAHGPVRIMFPMVSTRDEARAGRKRVTGMMDRLRERGLAFDEELEIGIMIEVPAAAEMAPLIAPEVDFFSIGTNDLTQYVMAADRANPKVKDLFDPFSPAVLRMIAKSISAAHDAGIWIGMCGAMAGSPEAVPILLGLGLDEFSMTPADIAEFKLTVSRMSLPACRDLAADVLELGSAAEVRERAAAFAGSCV